MSIAVCTINTMWHAIAPINSECHMSKDLMPQNNNHNNDVDTFQYHVDSTN